MTEQIKQSAAIAAGDRKHRRSLGLVDEVDNLAEEVRTLALNLAIYLAKIKAETRSEQLARMEPEFIRLVNGTIKVVQEVTIILNAARNMERMIYDVPATEDQPDRMETRLRSVLSQCADILRDLREAKRLGQ